MPKRTLARWLAVVVASSAMLVIPRTETAHASTPSFLDNGAVYETHPMYYAGGHTFSYMENELPTLAEEGVGTVYMQPFFNEPFTATSDDQRFRNRYLIADYNTVDLTYAPNGASDLQHYIATAHADGIKVVFDLVLNHTCSKATQEQLTGDCVFNQNGYTFTITEAALDAAAGGAANVLKSTDGYGNTIFEVHPYTTACGAQKYDFYGLEAPNSTSILAYNASSPSWGPAVDDTNPGLITYMENLTTSFINTYDFDGWRVDAPANDYNPTYFPGDHSMVTLENDLRSLMDTTKPGMVLFNETSYVDNSTQTPALDQMGDAAYDATYTIQTLGTAGVVYPGQQPGCDLASAAVPNLIDTLNSENIQDNRSRLRFDQNHDVQSIYDNNSQLAHSLLVFNTAIHPGIPMIEAGESIGALTNATYGDQLDTVPNVLSPAQRTELAFYQKVLTLRQETPALANPASTLTNILASTTGNTAKNYAIERSYNGQQAIAMVNFSATDASDTLTSSWAAGQQFYDVLNGTIVDPHSAIDMQPYSSRILLPTILNEPFDGLATGFAPSGWTVAADASTSATVAAVPSSTDRSVKLSDTTTGGKVTVARSFQAQTGRLEADYSFEVATTAQWEKFYLQSGGTIAVEMNVDTNGNLTYRKPDGTYAALQAVAGNTWYDVKVIVDVSKQVMDVYVGGVLKVADAPLRTTVAGIDTILFGTGTPETDTAYINNVVVKLPLLDQNFDADTTNAQPPGWTLQTPTGTSVLVQQDPSATDQSMQLLDNDSTSGSYAYAYRAFTAQSTPTLVSYRFKVLTTGKWEKLYLYSGTTPVVEMNVNNTGNLTYLNGTTYTTLQAVAANTWYKVDVVANPSTHRMDVYVNGVLEASAVPFYYAGTSSFDTVFFGTAAVQTDTFTVNDVRVTPFN
jgi:glycosidase